MTVLIYCESVGQISAVVFELSGSLAHASGYLLGQLRAVPLPHRKEHAFLNNAGTVRGDILLGRHDPYTILSKDLFIIAGISHVAGKTVQLIDKDNFKITPFAVCDHMQKFRTPVRSSRLRTVYIFMYDIKAILFSIASAFRNLPLNGHLGLVI